MVDCVFFNVLILSEILEVGDQVRKGYIYCLCQMKFPKFCLYIFLCLLILVSNISGASNEEIITVHKSKKETSKKENKDDHLLPAILITGGAVGTILALGTVWWWDRSGFTGKWKMKKEGFFSNNTYSGGADKAGHFYASYVEFRTMVSMYELIGIKHDNALLLSGLAIFSLSTGIEMIDAFTHYGFSYEDVVFNAFGLGLGYFTEKYPKFDSLIGLRWSYFPSSRYLEMEKETSFVKKYIRLINDYNGMTFFLDVKFAGMGERTSNSVLKYFLFGLNYNTIDYSPSGDNKQRNLGFHIGLNVPVILKSIFNKNNWAVRSSSTFAKFYAFPFTNLLFQYDLDHKKMKLNFGIAGRIQITF